MRILACDVGYSWDRFENYHATVAMWSMLASPENPDTKQTEEVCKRVIDKAECEECPLFHKCDEWGKFIEYLKSVRRHQIP